MHKHSPAIFLGSNPHIWVLFLLDSFSPALPCSCVYIVCKLLGVGGRGWGQEGGRGGRCQLLLSTDMRCTDSVYENTVTADSLCPAPLHLPLPTFSGFVCVLLK